MLYLILSELLGVQPDMIVLLPTTAVTTAITARCELCKIDLIS